jgi:serine/threonine-protein kinase PknK
VSDPARATDRAIVWLRRAGELSRRLVEDPAATTLPAILDAAIELASAERGFLVRLPEGGPLRVEVGRGFDRQALSGATGAVSRRVVEEVLKKGEAGVVTTREEDAALLGLTTVRERHVLAILCVPMRLRGKTVGVVYLDHRFRPDAFRPDDVEPLRLFADQAALAIEGEELRAERERALLQLEQAKAQLAAQAGLEARRRELKELQRAGRQGERPGLGALVGGSAAAQDLYLAIERAARSRDPVLIVGETGSGKTLVAAELHRLTHAAQPPAGAQAPLVELACARLTPAALEAALAGAGTLVLEEVADASPELQAALVLALQAQRRPGAPGTAPVPRLVATTRHDLAARSKAGAWREDLHYRLDVLRVEVPPLRVRASDVPLLIDHLAASRPGGAPLELTPTALQALADHAWPGNLHELANVVARLAALGKKVTTSDLPPGLATRPVAAEETIEGMSRRMVVDALEACRGNKVQAAKRLGIQRSTLYRILDKHGLR